MEIDLKLKDPWLIAVWPGMGGVAQIAGAYLTRKLEASAVLHLAGGEHFEIRSIKVEKGILVPSTMNSGAFFAWRNPTSGPDLVIFLADEQPAHAPWRYCESILQVAKQMGIKRVVTFAAMGTMLHPKENPRVFVVATRSELLEELKKLEVQPLEEAEIGGLNGLFLAVASSHGIEGAGLLGEFPYFAAGVPNPKASLAALRVFTKLAKIPLDLAELESHVPEVEKGLSQVLEKLQETAQARAQGVSEVTAEQREGEEWKRGRENEDIDDATKARIEKLFDEAKRDRSTAMHLKAELDQLGVFKRYEDRFLDLFKKGG
jgi:proteasome assembly chaperone (PAC2) family protein